MNLRLNAIPEVGEHPQTGGASKFRDVPDKNGFSHVAESLQYLLVGGGEARLLVRRPQIGPRPTLAVMG